MKKMILILFLLNIATVFAFDIKGSWCKNTLTPNKKDYYTIETSWGKCKLYDDFNSFIIDSDENGYFIDFYQWGKVRISEYIESDETITMKIVWNNYDSYISFHFINEIEIYIERYSANFNIHNGTKNRYFKLEGPGNHLNNPLLGKINTTTEIKWFDDVLGILKKSTPVIVISIKNSSTIYDEVNKKYLFVKVFEDDVSNIYEDYYLKKTSDDEPYIFGTIPLEVVDFEDNIIIE